MNIQQLKCFVEVAKTLNFTQASKNLYISQTAVTNHIKHLEDSLGFLLFERTRQKVSLTDKGKIFLQSAKKMIDIDLECYQLVDFLNHQKTGKLRIGYLRGLEECLLIRIFEQFYQKYEFVELEFHRHSRQTVEMMLKKYQLDCIFTSRVGYGDQTFSDECDHLLVADYPFVAVMRKNHFLSHKKTLSYFEVKNQSNVVMDTSEPHFMSGDLDVVLMQLLFHDDTAILADFIKGYGSYQQYLSFVPLDTSRQTFQIYFVWRKNDQNEVLHALIDQLKEGGYSNVIKDR